jgi:hypothetical protein
MATLNSPGVLVSVVDESFYLPAAPGTIPLVFVASASNKQNASGTATAAGTLDANAGKVWTITSQRDLADTFGTPYFQTDASGNPVNAGELNEYGLQATYSLLGVSSRAFVVRADVDLGQLHGESSIPNGDPASGTYWVDTANSLYGISEWDATNAVFVNKIPLVIDNDNKDMVAALAVDEWVPNASFGSQGNYAITVTSENTNQVWYKNTDNAWVKVGSNNEDFSTSWHASTCWQTSWPVVSSTGFNAVNSSTSFKINTVSVTLGSNVTPAGVASSINSQMYTYGVGARVVNNKLAIYADAGATSNGSTADGKIAIAAVGTATQVLTSLGLAAGTYGNVDLAVQPHTQVPRFATNANPTGSVYIKTTAPNTGANWSVKYFNGSTKTWGTVSTPIYASSAAALYAYDKAGGLNVPVGTLYIESNYDHGTGDTVSSPLFGEFKVYRRNAVYPTTITYSVPSTFTGFAATTSTFQIKETVANSSAFSAGVTVTLAANATLTDFVTAVSAAGLTNVSAEYDSTADTISLSHALGGDIKLLDGTNTPLTGNGANALGFTAYNMSTGLGTANLYATGEYETDGFTLKASNWKPLVFEAKTTAPYTTPADGQLWYSSVVNEVDIMYHNGSTWVGYKTAFPTSDPKGPQVTATAPTTQSDGTPLVDGDIWISTADMENYGKVVYVWNGSTLKWILQDVTDQVTPNGWLFADARWAASGQASEPATIKALLSSNYLDPDAPDPALYPEGMRLWNLRRSGYNVKKYHSNYINIYANDGKNIRYNNDIMDNTMDPYFADRWVSASPNNADGSGTFGRHAQRGVVVAAFKSLVDTNTAIRDTDTLTFNLIACPGYPEAVQNMVAFNIDRKQTAFVLGDTPFRLAANGTDLAAWGNNTNGALDNNDEGGVTHDQYMAFYYPSGYTNDNLGNYIVVPPSHMMMRTIAKSDSVSFPWFAPAGLRRGIVDNATAVGYVEATTGEFKQASLYESLRDVMAQNGHINPIATLPGSGIVVMGQYTRASVASALDRVNVARLVAYIRKQLEILSRPFLFEPNDKITRDEIKAAADSFLLELVGQRALYDFITVCDESNNTPARIDRSELWMDIAIEPVKAVEFIYIPLRLVNTGAIAAGNV